MPPDQDKIIEFEIIVDGALIEDFWADGVIVAHLCRLSCLCHVSRRPIVDLWVDAIV